MLREIRRNKTLGRSAIGMALIMLGHSSTPSINVPHEKVYGLYTNGTDMEDRKASQSRTLGPKITERTLMQSVAMI